MTKAHLQEAVDAFERFGSKDEAAKHLRIPLTTFASRLKIAAREGVKPSVKVEKSLHRQIKELEAELKAAHRESADAAAIKQIVGAICERTANAQPPAWVSDLKKAPSSPGVPTLLLSDLHWGERVFPSQVNGVNEYNMTIARTRLRNTIESFIGLTEIISPKLDYPGVVVPLGGDMISGDIHEELSTTNEIPTIPTVLDLWENLASAIRRLTKVFGHVFLPCVTGNHGRNTHKIQAKNRQHTSFDWMLYQCLAREFANDKRVTFMIPDGPDALYRVYGTRYLLTHLDQFRGGDGMIGALGPIIRGDHKKRSRNGQIDLNYDVLVGGHWHQYIHLTRLIVNGSLKGYDEYANQNNFGFEPAQQAAWLTHPKYGITYRFPILCDRDRAIAKTEWVSVASGGFR